MEQTSYVRSRLTNVLTVNDIVTLHNLDLPKSFSGPGEAHDFWEMVYVSAGAATALANGKQWPITQGQAIFHQPGEFHNIITDHANTANIFIISFVCSSPAMCYFNGKLLTIPTALREHIVQILGEGKTTYDLPSFDPGLKQLVPLEQPVFGGQQMIKTHLEQLLIGLIRSAKDENPALLRYVNESSLVAEMVAYLDEHVYDRLTLSQVCSRFHYSKSHLCGLFQEMTGYSIMEYFSMRKIDEAGKLIREQKLNFTEISSRLGICDSHYFSRLFKKYTGMTPRMYAHTLSDASPR